jgi:hypothetical protein
MQLPMDFWERTTQIRNAQEDGSLKSFPKQKEVKLDLPNPQKTGCNLLQSGIGTRLTRCQFDLDNFAPHFHNSLLLTKPVIVGNQFGEVGILQFSLSTNPGLTGNAGSHLEHTHRTISSELKFEKICLAKSVNQKLKI